jgi:hypothetical protein
MRLEYNPISESINVFTQDEEDKVPVLSSQEGKCQRLFTESSYKASPSTDNCVSVKHNIDVSGSGEVTFTWGGSEGPTVSGKGNVTVTGKDGTSVTLKGSGGTNQENRIQTFVNKDPDPNKNNGNDNGKGK